MPTDRRASDDAALRSADVHADPAPASGDLPAEASSHLLTTSVSRLNRLRAAVLGCNDGITSTAGLVTGVAAAGGATGALLVAGVSGLVAGSLSMAGGEYSSVRAQRDSHDALLLRQRRELETMPDQELDELAHLYALKGLSTGLARQVAAELSERDALAAHADIELGIDLDDLVDPREAAIASATAFLVGGVLPVLAIVLPPASARIAVCFAAVVVALALTGFVAARLGQAPPARAAVRNAAIGSAAMLITLAIGSLVGNAV